MYFTYFKQKDMKISKSGLLDVSLVFTVIGLWLTAVSMAQRQLYVDLNNASQYVEKVQFITTWSKDSASLEQIGNGFVKIETNNFILTQTGNKENSISGKNSSILWWEGNKIEWKGKNVILWWKNNSINGEYNVILWWENNKIENWKYSVIPWWKNNTITWDYSVALGSNNKVEGTRSVVAWDRGYVKGDYSVALWKNSKVEANNSFLWTDGSTTKTLTQDNVFVVMAGSGMIINTGGAHRFARLTIWWPLILSSTDKNIQCGWWVGGWILKLQNAGSQKCLCSCDGSWRNSMLGKGRCMSVCDFTLKPECGTKVERVCDQNKVSFSWSCEFWTVAEWTWSFFMDKNEKVHWSCQTDDGTTIGCSGDVINAGETLPGCESYKCIDGDDDLESATLVAWSDTGLTWYTKKKLYPSMDAAVGHKCAYVCNEPLNFYKIVEWKPACVRVNKPCDEENLACSDPLITGSFIEEITKYTWDCVSINWTFVDSCLKCREENWYYEDNDWNCVPLTCHHCAHQWFPYCFPIDFSPLCKEQTYLNQ